MNLKNFIFHLLLKTQDGVLIDVQMKRANQIPNPNKSDFEEHYPPRHFSEVFSGWIFTIQAR